MAIRGRLQEQGPVHSFYYGPAGFQPLGTIPGYGNVLAHEIDNQGAITGRLTVPLDGAFVWQSGLMRALDGLVPPSESVTVLFAEAISPSGIIVAKANTSQAVNVTVLLEPVVFAGDANPDCTVDVDDLISVIVQWGQHNVAADVTGDGVVDVDDFIVVVLSWSV
jgi:hypothetical protein